MSKLGARLITAAKEARAFARGEDTGAVVHTPVDVKAIRSRLGLTQPEFADRFGLPVGSLRDWEQHRTAPDGAARTLLAVIDHNPRAVEKAVTVARKKTVLKLQGGKVVAYGNIGLRSEARTYAKDKAPPKGEGRTVTGKTTAGRREKAAG